MPGPFRLAKRCLVGLLLLAAGVGLAAVLLPGSASGRESDGATIAKGAGTTIIHSGTGSSGGFVPVLTTVAFHAERAGGGVTGSFDCLAYAPEGGTGPNSAQFTVNAMYVIGQITGATVKGDTATLTGTFGGSSTAEFGSLLELAYPASTPPGSVSTRYNNFRQVLSGNPCPSSGTIAAE